MKRLLMSVLLGLLMTAGPLQAGLFKNSVDLADLSEVEIDRLASLKDSEFEVFLAEVRLNAAKAGERRADGGVKAAKRVVEAETLDRKAAEAEAKAAKANEDGERLTIANTQIQSAEEDLKTAKLLLKWQEQEREARQAGVKMAKSGLDLAEAQRDLHRARLLVEANVAAAEKYKPEDLEKSVGKRQKEFDESSRIVTKESVKVEKLKLEWQRVAGNVEPPEQE